MAKAKDAPKLFENSTILSIASSHQRSPAQVILRWCTQRGIAVIPKSNSLQRQKENLNTEDFNLTEQDIKAISALDRGLRFNNPPDVCVYFIFNTSFGELTIVSILVYRHALHLCLNVKVRLMFYLYPSPASYIFLDNVRKSK